MAAWHSSSDTLAAMARPATDPSTIPSAFACDSMKVHTQRAVTGRAITEDVAIDECSFEKPLIASPTVVS